MGRRHVAAPGCLYPQVSEIPSCCIKAAGVASQQRTLRRRVAGNAGHRSRRCNKRIGINRNYLRKYLLNELRWPSLTSKQPGLWYGRQKSWFASSPGHTGNPGRRSRLKDQLKCICLELPPEYRLVGSAKPPCRGGWGLEWLPT